jgi:hypothetical protein
MIDSGRAIELLGQQLDKAVELLPFDDPEVTRWWRVTERIVEEAFGRSSKNYSKFVCLAFSGRTTLERRQREHESSVRGKKALLRAFMDELALFPTFSPPQSQRTRPTLAKAFVSHSTQDRSFVERFAADLRSNCVDAWCSGWEIKPGDSIRVKIEEGLEGCEYFIIVLSKSSISSKWVQKELDAATVRNLAGKVHKIIPIKIEDCGDLPPTLGSLCWEDFSSQPYDSALKRVLDSIIGVDVRPPLGQSQGSTLAMALPNPQHPEIISADWGIGEPNYKDKKELLAGYLEARTPELRASNRYFHDDYKNEAKHLRVRYRWAGSTQIRTRTFAENDFITFT